MAKYRFKCAPSSRWRYQHTDTEWAGTALFIMVSTEPRFKLKFISLQSVVEGPHVLAVQSIIAPVMSRLGDGVAGVKDTGASLTFLEDLSDLR